MGTYQATQHRLTPTSKLFLRAVPQLIIEHNIYGVEIDLRAAQIASLALWLRAQRAWHEAGVKAKDRPLIGRGHVLAAIAPPAESELRQQFASKLDPQDAELFEQTLKLLKGLPELGVLLQVERELPDLIRKAYVGKGTGLFAEQERESWQQAEARLREALTDFALAARSTYQGRLFAQDALAGTATDRPLPRGIRRGGDESALLGRQPKTRTNTLERTTQAFITTSMQALRQERTRCRAPGLWGA